MAMAGRSWSASDYRYGYQGSEVNRETYGNSNQYTTEFRQLDPRFGRWFSTDPVFQPHQSPYNSMDGNPVNLTDVLGDQTGGDDEPKKIDRGMETNNLSNKKYNDNYLDEFEKNGNTYKWNEEKRVFVNIADPKDVLMRDKTAAYKNLNYNKIKYQVEVRTKGDGAKNINQIGTGTCGPAAVSYIFAKNNPKEYKRLLLDLYEYGEGYINAKYVSSDPDHFDFKHKKGDFPHRDVKDKNGNDLKLWMDEADFIMLGTLQAYAKEGTYDPTSKIGTMSWDVVTLIELIFNDNDVETTYNPLSLYMHDDNGVGDLPNMKYALKQGGGVVMMINSGLIYGDSWSFFPNHYVAFAGGLKVDVVANTVDFNVFTWGEIKKIRGMSYSDFHDTYYGAYYINFKDPNAK